MLEFYGTGNYTKKSNKKAERFKWSNSEPVNSLQTNSYLKFNFLNRIKLQGYMKEIT